jgi:hypothetical protein
MKKFLLLLVVSFGIQQLHATFTVTTTQTNVSCNGGCNGTATAIPSGGVPPYTYSWAPSGATSASVSTLCAGSYTVTVVDGALSTASATVTILQPSPLTETHTIVNPTCYGNCNGSINIIPSGGTAPYTYLWAPNGTTTQVVNGICAGNYSCTITDPNGCTLSPSFTLTQPGTLNSSVTPAGSTTCVYAPVNFQANSTGGSFPYTCSWTSGGGTPATSTSPNPQFYWTTPGTQTITVTVTDANGCSSTSTTTITVMTAPVATISPSFPTVCQGSSITLTGSGGMTYNWSPSFMTGATVTLTPLYSTTYTLTVTNSSGCTATATTTVYVNPSPTVTISSSASPICSGATVALTASGAMAYSWVPGNLAGSTVNVSPASTISYTVTGSDANGCIGTASTTITVNSNPTAIVSSMTEASCNGADGSATITPVGNAPFVYSWVPAGGNFPTASGLMPNNIYTVTVTDVNGCFITLPVTVGDSCDFVWPGDANDDAVADNNDILDIGIANGATGTTRANATLNWIGQPSTPWGQTLLSGTDYKFVDCNGDGTIDPNDTTAVIQNFGFTHNNRMGAPVYDASLPDLTISMGQNTLASMSSGTMTVALGNSTTPVSNLYGIAFTLNFDPAQIDASSFRMNESGTWMGSPGTDMMGIVMNAGTGTGSVQVALTRLDHQNVNGFGNLANMGFVTTANLVGTGSSQNVNFTISNVTVISANETTQTVNTVNDSVNVVDPGVLGISAVGNSRVINAYPNPFDESVAITLSDNLKGKNVELTLTDAEGRVVLSQNFENSGIILLQRGQLESGIYFCTVRSEDATVANTKLIIK